MRGLGAGLAAKALVFWLRRVAATTVVRLRTCSPDLNLPSVDALARQLLADADSGHVIVPFWSAHQLTIALLTEERFGLAVLRARFEVVADDSFGGEMMRRLGDRLGLSMRPIHSRGNPQRFNDVADWLRNPESFLIAVDGASRYGTIPTGIVRLASRMKSTVWPLAVRSRAFIRIPGLVAEIPLPYAPIALGVAAPLTVERGTSIPAIADELRRRLNEATAAATLISDVDSASSRVGD